MYSSRIRYCDGEDRDLPPAARKLWLPERKEAARGRGGAALGMIGPWRRGAVWVKREGKEEETAARCP
jgi:hypothetical protein